MSRILGWLGEWALMMMIWTPLLIAGLWAFKLAIHFIFWSPITDLPATGYRVAIIAAAYFSAARTWKCA